MNVASSLAYRVLPVECPAPKSPNVVRSATFGREHMIQRPRAAASCHEQQQ